jgi:hypothetical protein
MEPKKQNNERERKRERERREEILFVHQTFGF